MSSILPPGERQQQEISFCSRVFQSKAPIGVVAGVAIAAIGYLLQHYIGLGSMYAYSIMGAGGVLGLGSLVLTCVRSCRGRKEAHQKEEPTHFLDDEAIKQLAKSEDAERNQRLEKSSYPLFEVLDEPETVRTLLQNGANPNQVNYTRCVDELNPSINMADQRTPLHFAAARGHFQTVQILLEHSAEVDAKDFYSNTPLHLAADAESAKSLISKGAEVNAKNRWNQTPLYRAICLGRLEVVKVLVENNASLETPIVGDGLNALQAAAKSGHIDIVNYLLEQGVNVEKIGDYMRPPLHLAVEKGDIATVNALLQKSANKESQGAWKNTPLHVATTREVAELISTENTLNAKNEKGRTPLHEAVARNNTEVAKFLIERRADVNIKDNEGNTPLHLATSLEMLKLLVENGGDPLIENKENLSVLDVQLKKSSDNRELILGLEKLHYLLEQKVKLDGNSLRLFASFVEYCAHCFRNCTLAEKIEGLAEKIFDKFLERGMYIDEKIFGEVVRARCHQGVGLSEKLERSLKGKVAAFQDRLYEESKKAEVDSKNRYGDTPLHLARTFADVDDLLNRGAKLDQVNGRDQTAFEVLFKSGDEKIVQRILQAIHQDVLNSDLYQELINNYISDDLEKATALLYLNIPIKDPQALINKFVNGRVSKAYTTSSYAQQERFLKLLLQRNQRDDLKIDTAKLEKDINECSGNKELKQRLCNILKDPDQEYTSERVKKELASGISNEIKFVQSQVFEAYCNSFEKKTEV